MLKISKCLYCRKGSSFYWKVRTLKVWNCKEQGVTCSFISYLCGYCPFGALSPLGFSLGFDPLLSSVLSLVYELFTGSPTVYETHLLSLLQLSYLVNTLTLVILESQVTGLPNPAHLLVERQNADPCPWSDFHTDLRNPRCQSALGTLKTEAGSWGPGLLGQAGLLWSLCRLRAPIAVSQECANHRYRRRKGSLLGFVVWGKGKIELPFVFLPEIIILPWKLVSTIRFGEIESFLVRAPGFFVCLLFNEPSKVSQSNAGSWYLCWNKLSNSSG